MNTHNLLQARRRALLKLLAGGLGVATLLRHAGAQVQMAKHPGLYLVQGDVRINGKPARAGELVRASDTVVTGRGALAVFAIGDDAFLARENSRVDFAGRDVVLDTLRLVTGKLLSVFVSGHSVNSRLGEALVSPVGC